MDTFVGSALCVLNCKLNLIAFLKRYSGLQGIKCQFFQGFWPFLETDSKRLSYFCMIMGDNRAHCLSQIAFMKKIIPD